MKLDSILDEKLVFTESSTKVGQDTFFGRVVKRNSAILKYL